MSNTFCSLVGVRFGVLVGVLAVAVVLATPATARSQTASPSVKVSSAAPCCSITAINLKTGVVTAVDEANQPFRFQVVIPDPPKGRTTPFQPINGVSPINDIKLLRSLKVGQKVYVNFATKKVSIDGGAPCCSIIGTTVRP